MKNARGFVVAGFTRRPVVIGAALTALKDPLSQIDKPFHIRYERSRSVCRKTSEGGSLIIDFQGNHPRVDPTVFIAPNSLIIGDVELGAGANVWFFCLIRGDVNSIKVGAGCNIQDGCILHAARERFSTELDADVILGHRVTAHGCHIGHGALIGIGAMVLNGARVGEEAIVGAGAVVTPGTVIPPRTLALGIPAKPVRELAEGDYSMMSRVRESYRELTQIYRESLPAEEMKRWAASEGVPS